jgi:hypothetical protein
MKGRFLRIGVDGSREELGEWSMDAFRFGGSEKEASELGEVCNRFKLEC